MKVRCYHCGQWRVYNPSEKTQLEDLSKRSVQCFVCGKSFNVAKAMKKK